jgi:threonine dehydratase
VSAPPKVLRPPTVDDVRAAARRLEGVARHTPLRRSAALSRLAGSDVWLKLECEQVTGSFKIRGAFNAIALLPPEARERGVVASSAGNHGQGVAAAAHAFGIPATIFVPRTAPEVKKAGMRAHGARVDDSAPHYDAAAVLAHDFAAREDIPYLDPCAGDALLAGQGTVASEILGELPDLAALVVSVGGGGLLGGMGAYVRAVRPSTRIIGAQSTGTAAMARSLDAGHLVEIPDLPTLADGLAGQVDDYGLEIGRRFLDDIALVSERELAEGIRWLWVHEGVRAEGAGAVGVAALLARRLTRHGPMAIVITGGNIDADRHARVLAGAEA